MPSLSARPLTAPELAEIAKQLPNPDACVYPSLRCMLAFDDGGRWSDFEYTEVVFVRQKWVARDKYGYPAWQWVWTYNGLVISEPLPGMGRWKY